MIPADLEPDPGPEVWKELNMEYYRGRREGFIRGIWLGCLVSNIAVILVFLLAQWR